MSDLPLWDTRVQWENLYDDGEVVVVPPVAFLKSRTHCLAVDLDSLTVVGRVEHDPEVDPVLAYTGDCHDGVAVLFTAHRSSLIHVYRGTSLEPVLTFKSQHNGPVIAMHCCLKSQRLVTVGVGKDICMKVWDIGGNTCLQSVRNLPAKPTRLELADGGLLICVGNVEGNIQVFDCNQSYKMTLLSKHVSPVSALKAFGDRLLSGGRDEVIVVWNLRNLVAAKVIPTFETIECFVFSQDGLSFSTGGSSGRIRLWDTESGKEELEASNSFAKWGLENVPLQSLAVVEGGESDADTIYFVQDDVLFKGPSNARTVSLNRNSINDMALIMEKFLVVAGNSPALKIYSIADYGKSKDEPRPEMSVYQTTHEDAIVHLSAFGGDSNTFVSAGKENHISVWKLASLDKLDRLYTCSGHSSKITAVRIIGNIIASSDDDGIMKIWVVPEEGPNEEKKLSAFKTVIAHQKEVSCLDGCLEKQILVSGSLDKTAKVWNLRTMSPMGTISGHRRGVTAAKISAHERIMATGSQDATIKLWELNTFTCFKTLEGQQSHVLHLEFSTLNMLHSVGNDGVHYVWNIHASAPKVGAFEGHESQVWCAIATGPDTVVTGGADGKVIFWANNAEVIAARKEEEMKLRVKNDQTLENCILKGKVAKALKLAVKLDRPKVAYNLLAAAYKEGTMNELLDALEDKLVPRLVDYVMVWNANSRHYTVAQFVQKYYLSKNLDAVAKLGGSRETLLKLMAFNEKHSARVNKLNSRFAIVDTLLK